MAIDGVGILESDLAQDTYHEILDLYDQGKSKRELYVHVQETLHDIKDSLSIEIYVTACCFTLWEIGMLDNIYLEKLMDIVKNGADTSWEIMFDRATNKERNTVLVQFLRKVSKPNPNIRKLKTYKPIINRFFTKGDVFVVQIDKLYYCLIFEKFWQHREDAYYSFVVTTYRGNTIPTLTELLLEEVPVTKTKKQGGIGVRMIDIYYMDLDTIYAHFIKIGTAQLNIEIENAGFSSFINFNGLTKLKAEIEKVLLGLKTDFYIAYEIEV